MTNQVRLKLLEAAIMKSILHNVEAFPTLTKKEMEELESIQHNILVQLLEMPTSTPYNGILMETGVWKMEARVDYRRLMLYHRIIHSEDSRMIKKLVKMQMKFPRAGTWYNNIKTVIEKYGIEENVEECLKSEWKKKVKEKIGKRNEDEIRKKCEQMVKTRFVKEDNWGRKTYINQCSTDETKKIMRLRLCMVPLPCNQRSSQREEGCKICKKRTKIRQEHFSCEGLIRLRRSCGVVEDETRIEDVCKLRRASSFMHSVSKLVL